MMQKPHFHNVLFFLSIWASLWVGDEGKKKRPKTFKKLMIEKRPVCQDEKILVS